MGGSTEDSSDVSVVSDPGKSTPENAASTHDEPQQQLEVQPDEQVQRVSEHGALVAEREKLLAKVRQLEMELQRYREHAERTSKLFLSVTDYAERVRENARRDAELALRKARARVDKLNRTALELERAEEELARIQDELAHLQRLTDTTRERLSAFLNAGLQALNGELRRAQDDSQSPALNDLPDTLRERLTSTWAPKPPPTAEVEEPVRSGPPRASATRSI